MQPACEECNRLWQEYGAATMAHIASDSELRLAALRHETENITILTLEAEDAPVTAALAMIVLGRAPTVGLRQGVGMLIWASTHSEKSRAQRSALLHLL